MIMDEKEETQQIQESSEGEEKEEAVEGKTPKVVEDANAAADRIEKATEALKAENDRRDDSEARRALSGQAEAGQQPLTQKETDEEYTERFQRGEADPLKDDGVK